MKKLVLFFVVLVAPYSYATPDQIRDLLIESSSGTKVVLTCTVPKTLVGGGSTSVEEVVQIELRMDTVGDYITNNNKYELCKLVQTVTRPGLAGTKITFVVENLEPYTRYYFACRAKDTQWGLVSYVVSVTTTSGTVTPVDKPTTKTIKVRWTYKEDGGDIPDAVVILHGSSPALTDRPITVNGNTYQADIIGLTWGVIHYWQVVTVNSAGKEKFSPLRSNSQ